MVSKRRFFILVMMMFVLLFMFQFTQVVKKRGNTYDTNPFLQDKDAIQVADVSKNTKKQIVFIGDREGKYGKVVSQWCNYTKRKMISFDSLEFCQSHQLEQSELVVTYADMFSSDADLDEAIAYMKKEVSFVFCDLPEPSTIAMSSRWRKILGIKQVKSENVTLSGVNLFDGFLLGGQAIYQPRDAKEKEERQDLDWEIPWYLLESGSKSYMVGMMEDASVKNEELPAIVWRASVENAKVFAVNGDYMGDCTGVGFLDAMMAELHRYEIYPVVNAQNLSMANFSAFANENEEKIKALYTRKSNAVFRDIIWPGLCANLEQSGSALTCFFSPQMKYDGKSEPETEELIFYLKEMREKSAEAGISLDCKDGIEIYEKLKKDASYMKRAKSKYQYGAVYLGEEETESLSALSQCSFSSITTAVGGDLDENILSMADGTTTLQSVTSNGISHTYRQDIRMKSLQTALAYSNIVFDLKQVMWPEKKEDRWEVLFEKFTSNTNTYWKAFESFDKTTVSQADKKIRNLLAADYSDSCEGDTIYLHISGKSQGETIWFLLRTHNEEIDSTVGAEYKKVEDGAYLIGAKEEKVSIRLKSKDAFIYPLTP